MRLISTPSTGQSEVLETLHFEGAIASGVQIFRIGTMVAHRYGGDDDRQAADSQLEADTLTVLGALQGLGYVTGHNDRTGATVDLTAGPASTTRVVLTGAGRVAARHPRPRPRNLRD